MPLTKFKLSSIADGGITTAKLANDAVTSAKIGHNIALDGTESMKVPVGNTSQRPGSAVVGNFRFNTTLNFLEQYTTDGWTAIASPPQITGVSPNVVDEDGGGNVSIVVSGSFFDSSALISFINNSGTAFNAASTSYTNASSVTAVVARSNFTNSNEPYDVKVTNGSGLAYTLENVINVDGLPSFNTVAGSLGTIEGGDAASGLTTSTIAATDPEGETVTYSVVTNALPSGLTLASNGVISGTTSELATGATSSFDIRANDGTGNTTDRTFTITVNATTYVYTTNTAWDIGSWSVTGAGIVASANNAWNNSTANATSWTGDAGNTNNTASNITGASSEFARHISFYRGSNAAMKVSGMKVFSGHDNSTDPLPAKDVAFYYSTDTTNGTNGTWTIITPKLFDVSPAAKHSAASAYVGQRTSAVSSNHVVLSGNYQRDGTYHSGSIAGTHQYYGRMHDTIVWDEVTCKGIRMDVRTKWSNGNYSGEKPHVSMIQILRGSDSGNIYRTRVASKIGHIESLSGTKFYLDPATSASGGSWDGTTLQDLSSNNFDFTPGSDYHGAVPTHSTTAGGTIQWDNGAGSLRKAANWATNDDDDGNSKHKKFTIGCWVKLSGGGSNEGVMFYGEASPSTNRRHYFRSNFSGSGSRGIRCGDSISEGDVWVDVPSPTGASNSTLNYLNSNTTKWHLFLSCCDDQGNRLVSWNGGRWMHYFNNGKNYAINSMSGTGYVGFGGDQHNDNSANHSYGPMFYVHDLVIPYENIQKEWNRHKTRFGW